MNFIEKLREKRLNWIKANRENGFEDGIRNLLTELYPDNAHFVYELLQNAEDARATKVMFSLNINGLSFCHNGNRQFTNDDIDSITSIGVSTKIGDFNQIGKFGVGFKSVFSYTNTPRIYSNKYAFEIHDLVCPKEIKQELKPNSTATLFYFPFNHKEKSKEKAFQEVKKTLNSLPENTILFLENIEEIHWEISDDKKESDSIKRSKTKQNFIEIEKNTRKSNWLLFKKEVPDKQGLYVAIAFKLLAVKDRFKFDKKVEKGDVSIFFPAEKENSKLRFFIHAPFAATVARDSIQNKEENNNLRDLLVELLIESLPKIKEFGMLDKTFLSILPHNGVILEEFYIPFRNRIIEIFQNEPYTLTWENEFLPASKLFRTTKEIREIINRNTILDLIIEDATTNEANWVTAFDDDSRNFLESLGIAEISFKKVLDKLAVSLSNKNVANEFLSKFSDVDLQNLYLLFSKGIEKYKEHFENYSYPPIQYKLKDAYIIRLQNGTHTKGVKSYFETELVKQVDEVNLVKAEVYESTDEQSQELLKKFFAKVGVRQFSDKDEIKLILDKHYRKDSLNIKDGENIKHLEKFIKYWKETEDVSVFSDDHFFLRVEDEENEKEMFSIPTNIYLDEPFEKTGYSKVAELQGEYELWSGYKDEIKDKDLVSFLKAVGVVCNLKIIKCSVHSNPAKLSSGFLYNRVTDSSTNEDYTIESLEKLLERQNRDISLLIWNTIKDLKQSWNINYFQARYSPNQSTTAKRGQSQLIHSLKKYAWLPDKNGNFHKPNEITREMLPNDFVPDNQNGWLDEIGMKSQTEIDNQKKNTEKEQRDRKEKAAKELNIDLEDFEQYKKDKEEFEEFRREKRKREKRKIQQSLPSNSSPNWSFDDSESKFKDRSRTVSENHTSKVIEYADTKIDARGFLKSQYTNELNVLVCQICQEEMPFQTYDGEWYFIATKIIEKTSKDNVANYLCCCPNCSEMFRQANPNQDEMISIITESSIDNCMLTLELAGNEIDIEFKEKHFEELFNFADRQSY